MSDNTELYIGNGNHLTVKSSYIVELKDQVKLLKDEGKAISLDIKIQANFETLPDEYHQIFLHILSARYGGTINCYDNITPFELPKPKTKKWYQFWK